MPAETARGGRYPLVAELEAAVVGAECVEAGASMATSRRLGLDSCRGSMAMRRYWAAAMAREGGGGEVGGVRQHRGGANRQRHRPVLGGGGDGERGDGGGREASEAKRGSVFLAFWGVGRKRKKTRKIGGRR